MKSKHLFFLLFLAFSCKSPDNKKLYEFDPRTLAENKITLSDIADDLSYIPLDNCFPLGLIYDRIEFINNSIYLSVKDIGILEFSRNGKFIRKIAALGRGPGEYTTCFDFTIDDNTGTIYNFDRGSIIKVYSKMGDFLRNISFREYGENINSFEVFKNKLFIYYQLQSGGVKYEWIILDSLGSLIKEYERIIPDFNSNWGERSGSYKYDNSLYYWSPFIDTVFTISPDLKIKPSFYICPGEHRFPKRSFYSFEEYSKYMHIDMIFETKRFLVIRYYYKKIVVALIDKKNDKSYLTYLQTEEGNYGSTLTGGIENNLDGGTNFLPTHYFMENDREYMVGFIDPFKLKDHIESNEFKNSAPKYPEKKKELEQLAFKLKETDNPVLMLVRLKK